MGTLYVVGTPIGNLEDITLRAIRILSEVSVIACEDTRRTGMLLEELRKRGVVAPTVHPKLVSYYEEIELRRIPEIIGFLQEGQSIALVSDAGMPAVSDPGFKLIRACIAEKLAIEVIPGASSVTTALVASGLPTDKFLFVGYPPKGPGQRVNFLTAIKTSTATVPATVILFESPYRVQKTLIGIQTVFGDIDVVCCRELTKKFEEVIRGSVATVIEHFAKEPKGEFVLLFHPDAK
jgi:16S rRNA (cytidine1402-2'-O)-methyltransferase